MTDAERYTKMKKKLVVIETCKLFTLYYDSVEKTLWVWNGVDFIGKDTLDLYDDLMIMV